MRFVFFITSILATANLLIIIVSSLTGINIYKKYGKQLLKAFLQFLLLLIAFLATAAICGLHN